jgi:para-aminobenzoate synthetase component I
MQPELQTNPSDWQLLMNRLGALGTPFLFILDFELKRPVIYTLDAIPAGIYYKVNNQRNYTIHPLTSHTPLHFEKKPVSFQEYTKAFDHVLKEIRYGNSFLLNLTFPTLLECDQSLHMLFMRAAAKYKLYFHGRFIVFSPEKFVQINDGIISSYPMKGTIDASLKNAKHLILNDEKEIAEHYTIVDLIRNDLSIVSKKVHVPRFRYLDLIHTQTKSLYQVSSEVSGVLPANYPAAIGDIMAALLPAGSISGAPKKKTVEIIRAAEGEERSYYTGVFGIFDGRNLDSGVMIRYIEQNGRQMRYRSGCGITAMSDCASEYNEMTDKVYVPTDRKHSGVQRQSV